MWLIPQTGPRGAIGATGAAGVGVADQGGVVSGVAASSLSPTVVQSYTPAAGDRLIIAEWEVLEFISATIRLWGRYTVTFSVLAGVPTFKATHTHYEDFDGAIGSGSIVAGATTIDFRVNTNNQGSLTYRGYWKIIEE